MTVGSLVARALTPAGAILAVAVVALLGPWSPLALDRANASFAAGDLDGAIRAYEAVAEGWHTPATRAEAAHRAGLLRRGRGDVRGAVRDYERAIDLGGAASERVARLVELAMIYKGELGDARACASAFEQAAVESRDPAHDAAAAVCWAEAGEADAALAAVDRAEARGGTATAQRALAAVEARMGAVADGSENGAIP
jgi:tetratricopeptide (TPR) repeat protein